MRTLNLIILFNYCLLATSCHRGNTPNKYKNNTNISDTQYLSIKNKLKDSIRFYVDNRLKAYYPKENDSQTEFVIDTIIFSPKMNKIAFFAISKNSNDKLASKGSHSDFHFDAYCFLGTINKTTIISIKWFDAYNIVNYDNEKEASDDIRTLYFNELNKGNQNKAEFNLDDIRFWDGPLWPKYYE